MDDIKSNNVLTTLSPTTMQNLSPRSKESRRAVFKLLSETLRPPPPNLMRRSSKAKGKGSPKLNKKSPRSSNMLPPIPSNQTSLSHVDTSKAKFISQRKTSNDQKWGGKQARGNTVDRPFMPTPLKDCHLSNVLRSARRCLQELHDAKESLSRLVAEDDQLARGIKKLNPTPNHLQLSQVALNITHLCQQAFVPAHRLNQTAIALYSAEDFLRYPSDIRTFDMHSTSSRIRLPDITFNNATVMKFRQVVDAAAETYNKFNGKGRLGEELQEILYSILRGYQDFYATTLGCQEIFKVLLYTGREDKAHLQQFLLALTPVDRSDMLVEIQDLRRILDEIVIFLEKLSWGSYVVYKLAGGNTVVETTPQDVRGGSAVPDNQSIPTYPAYPLLKARGAKPKKKLGGEMSTSTEPSGVNIELLTTLTRDPSRTTEVKPSKTGNKKSKFSKKKKLPEEVDEDGGDAQKKKSVALHSTAAQAGDSLTVRLKQSVPIEHVNKASATATPMRYDAKNNNSSGATNR